jgi:enoyl-CoA hydratase
MTLVKIQDGIAWLKINREEKLNALNKALLSELNKRFKAFKADPTIKVIVLTGSGSKAFVAGADITEFSSFNKLEGRDLSQHGNEKIFNFIEKIGKPVIAAINGYALGGGLELAMSCQIRIAATHAKMGLPEVSLGIIPGYGGTQRLPQLIGKGNAMEMILTGEMIGAKRALELGLVTHVVSGEELLSKAALIAGNLLKNSPNALNKAITAVNASDQTAAGFIVEMDQFSNCFGTDEFKEGVKAFLEKRKPNF